MKYGKPMHPLEVLFIKPPLVDMFEKNKSANIVTEKEREEHKIDEGLFNFLKYVHFSFFPLSFLQTFWDQPIEIYKLIKI